MDDEIVPDLGGGDGGGKDDDEYDGVSVGDKKNTHLVQEQKNRTKQRASLKTRRSIHPLPVYACTIILPHRKTASHFVVDFASDKERETKVDPRGHP